MIEKTKKIKFYYKIIHYLEILFIILNIIIGVVVIGKLYIYTKLNPYKYIPENYYTNLFLKGIFFSFDVWSSLMFTYLFIVTCYWFIFYKLQDSVFIIMPPQSDFNDNYRTF